MKKQRLFSLDVVLFLNATAVAKYSIGKKAFLCVCLVLSLSAASYAQSSFFKLYKDSAALVTDANSIVADFVKRVNTIKPLFDSSPVAILNTKPYLIFYSPKANQISLPIWHQVMPEQKEFFINLTGSAEDAERAFGFLFNGFYLPHELGHALLNTAGKKESNQYMSEYFANQIAVLYWKKAGREKEIEQSYHYAKKMLKFLKNPVPEGEDPIKYLGENYRAIASDPYKYGYIQFRQLVEIYEDKNLKNFDDFIKEYFSK